MKKPGWLDEFKVFISRGNVIDLAVGVVVGGAFTAIATALCPAIGYEKATSIVKKALKDHRTVVDVALEELSMPKEAIEKIVNDCLLENLHE